jgi:hypothetical protein
MDARAYDIDGESLFIHTSNAGDCWEFVVRGREGCAVLLNRRTVATGTASRASIERLLNLFLDRTSTDRPSPGWQRRAPHAFPLPVDHPALRAPLGAGAEVVAAAEAAAFVTPSTHTTHAA